MDTEFGKERLKISFNTYDFLGYFIPGLLFFAIIMIFEIKLTMLFDKKVYTPLNKFFNEHIINQFNNSHWAISIILLIILIVVIYVFGHLIASISAFALDRNFVGRCIKYPYRKFLALDGPEYRKEPYRAKFLSFLLIFNLIPIPFLFIKSNFNLYYIISLITLVFILIQIKPIYQFVSPVFEFFIDILRKFLYIGDTFPNKFRDNLKKIYEEKFDINPNEDLTYTFWFTVNYVQEFGQPFRQLLSNWFNLYSFSRNLSTAIYLSYVYILFLIFGHFAFDNNSTFINNFYDCSSKSIFYKVFTILLLIFSFILLLRYYYLYFVYYNKYLFRTFYYLNTTEKLRNLK